MYVENLLNFFLSIDEQRIDGALCKTSLDSFCYIFLTGITCSYSLSFQVGDPIGPLNKQVRTSLTT